MRTNSKNTRNRLNFLHRRKNRPSEIGFLFVSWSVLIQIPSGSEMLLKTWFKSFLAYVVKK